MASDSEFKSIRPYIDSEVSPARERLSHSSEFLAVFSRLTRISDEKIIHILQDIHTRDEFQNKFFGPAIKAMIAHTSEGVNIEGLEHLDKDKTYLFISNHRDIILDSAILNLCLREHGFKYTQAAIGSNLLVNEWVTDLVKLNSCFVIERGIKVREMIASSALRSEYLRETIKEGTNSVWIAQREGRTKNGSDKTQPSLLKMFKMSGAKDFEENFKELRIVPLAISYEWEPCDDLKTNELYLKMESEYTKTPEDDMRSMQTGLAVYKGRINFTVTPPINAELHEMGKLPSNGDRIESLTQFIDQRIYQNFKLWPNNYIAYDLLHSTNRFAKHYSEKEKEHFIQIMSQKIDRLTGNRSLLNGIYLEIYANPIKSKIDAGIIDE